MSFIIYIILIFGDIYGNAHKNSTLNKNSIDNILFLRNDTNVILSRGLPNKRYYCAGNSLLQVFYHKTPLREFIEIYNFNDSKIIFMKEIFKYLSGMEFSTSTNLSNMKLLLQLFFDITEKQHPIFDIIDGYLEIILNTVPSNIIECGKYADICTCTEYNDTEEHSKKGIFF